jgi:hypothetical protein
VNAGESVPATIREVRMERGPAEDLWRHTLGQIPTTFGRLVYLCSLRDTNSGAYRHFGLSQRFGDTDSDSALRKSHLDCFYEWLHYTLEQKKIDLDLYLSEVEGEREAILRTWLQLRPYRNLAPAGAMGVELELFLSDLDALLALLTNVHGVSAPDPES